ncbi:hypothetical protein J6590_037413 [Homalodisca vitripennis]|nr:hypothetical protein J6590_037413 [Homalodisca vitripennis]
MRHDRPCGRVMPQQYDSNTSATTIALHSNTNQSFSPVVSPCDTIAPVGDREPMKHDRPCGRMMRQPYDSNTSATITHYTAI